MNGTCCHQICAEALQVWIDNKLDPLFEIDAQPYLGREMHFWEWVDAEGEPHNGEDWAGVVVGEFRQRVQTATVEVTQEMVDACNAGIQFVMERTLLTGGHLEVEQRAPIGHFTGEQGASGTSDVVLIYGDTIESMDFKFGRHKVHAYDTLVPARGETPPVLRMNLQLACYVLGAYEKFGLIYDISRCKSTIIQPFLNHVSEFECSLAELLDVQDNYLKVKAEETRTNPVFKPTYDNCHFCRAKMTCEARKAAVVDLVLDGFSDAGEPILKPKPGVNEIGALYQSLDFIKEWCEDIAKTVWNELSAGRSVVRPDGLKYVLVQGRKGDRKWADPAKAEAMLKHMRLRNDEMYVMKVIGPSVVEKMAHVPKRKKADTPPPKINRLQWAKLQELITQAEGGMSVALETDTRPVLPISAEGFVDVPDAVDDCSDLLN